MSFLKDLGDKVSKTWNEKIVPGSKELAKNAKKGVSDISKSLKKDGLNSKLKGLEKRFARIAILLADDEKLKEAIILPDAKINGLGMSFPVKLYQNIINKAIEELRTEKEKVQSDIEAVKAKIAEIK